MIFCFSGTGNSRYIARRFAEALKDTIVDLNAKIKAQDNSLIQTGKNVIIVVPTMRGAFHGSYQNGLQKQNWHLPSAFGL